MPVITFSQPHLALDYCLENKDTVDLLVTDYDMPLLNGETLVEELRAAGFSGKVIMMTGYNETMGKDKLKALGISRLLFKPIDLREILAFLSSDEFSQ